MKIRAIPVFLILHLLLIGSTWAVSASSQESPSQADPTAFHQLQYRLDRAESPTLFHKDLTLLIDIGESRPAQVRADGVTLPFRIDSDSGKLVVTTAAARLDVTVEHDELTLGDIGSVESAVLYDNKGFAWSIGMDDNVGLQAQIAALEAYGWRGTLFLIADILVDERDEDWIVDPPYLLPKLADGWSVGNHTWDHNCGDPSEETIIAGQNRLQQLIDASAIPNYQIISFAAPCFVSEYHPIVLGMRERGVTSILYNESGNRTPIIVDPGPTEPFTLIADNPNTTANPFDLDEPIGRASWTDLNDASTEIQIIDAMANRFTQNGDHLWHNSLVHGDKSGVIDAVAGYLYNTYGPAGNNQVWVAPSDEIVSYILTRDNTTIQLISTDVVDEPVEYLVFMPFSARSERR